MGTTAGPSKSSRSEIGGNDDAMSLHTTNGDYNTAPEISGLPPPKAHPTYDDDAPEISGLPPAYSEEDPSSSAPFAESAPLIPHDHSYNQTAPELSSLVEGWKTSSLLDPLYDNNPSLLEATIRDHATTPPKLMVQLRGTHSEQYRNGNKNETRTITDFDVKVSLAPHLIAPEDSWMTLRTVENGEKAYRGGWRKTRAPGYTRELEVGQSRPGLTEWCHRYCASSASLKSFRLTRAVTGFNKELLEARLENLIRQTHYRGHTQINFPVCHEYVDVYSSSQINRWRTTTWIRWIFYLTFLWIFAWPCLFFATKHYAVAIAEWPFSRRRPDGTTEYARCSEEEWFFGHSRALRYLVLEGWQGEVSQEVLALRSETTSGEELRPRVGLHLPFGTDRRAASSVFGAMRSGFAALTGGSQEYGWGGDC